MEFLELIESLEISSENSSENSRPNSPEPSSPDQVTRPKEIISYNEFIEQLYQALISQNDKPIIYQDAINSADSAK